MAGRGRGWRDWPRRSMLRRVWPVQRPIGRAIAMAITSDAPDNAMCSKKPHGDAPRPGPVRRIRQPRGGLGDELHQAVARRAASTLRREPGREATLEPDQEQVGADGEDDRRHGSHQDLGRERVAVALEDEEPETPEPVAQDARDGDQADRRHGGEADADDDQRDGQRQLDPPEAPVARKAHPVGRLEDVAWHGVEARDDVAHEDQQRVEDERDQGGRDLDARDGDQERRTSPGSGSCRRRP